MFNEAVTKGFKGWRIAGEMAFFLKNNLFQELIDFERSARRVLDIPIIGMCACNLHMIVEATDSINLYKELIKTHGTVLFVTTDKELGRIEIRK